MLAKPALFTHPAWAVFVVPRHAKIRKEEIVMIRKIFFAIAIILVPLWLIVAQGRVAMADEQDELNNIEAQLTDLSNHLLLSQKATTPLEAEVNKLNSQIKNIQLQISVAEQQSEKLSESIESREGDIKIKYQVLSQKIRDYYKKARVYSPLAIFTTATSANELTRGLAYKVKSTQEDRDSIVAITKEVVGLESDKDKLEASRQKLGALQKKLDEQKDFFEHEIAGAKKWQAELSSKIATLTARQQSILSAKAGTFQTTVGDVPLADDPASRPDYNPGFSPAFAVFSFGAPHFKGMSQYGALGRAKSNQNYEEILRAYYGGGIEIRDHDQGAQITVEGYGTYSLEDYTKRIYEMPGSWGDEGGMEALKAQAVAARSYALARGGSICATEACQVFKPSPKGGNWETAVNATAGKVVYVNGQPLSTWYASTSGGYQESYTSNGYTTPSFWDTPSGRDGWTSQAYEKTAGSPWFYKAWYKTRSGDSCGKSHPWLTSAEMADILNAWVVLYRGGGDSARVTPESPCWGGSPYSQADLASIGGYNSVSSVSVQYSNQGITANVTFVTNKGSITIPGSEFYRAFNLRAPGRISLKSGLFNIEIK